MDKWQIEERFALKIYAIIQIMMEDFYDTINCSYCFSC